MTALHISENNRTRFRDLTYMLQDRYGPNSKEVSKNHWLFEVMTSGRRSQVVHLIYHEQISGGRDSSRIIVNSPIGPLPKRFNLEALLRRNATLDVGAICIEDLRNEDNELLTYITLRASHLIATLDFAEVWEMLGKTADTADNIEMEIFARDVH